MSDNITRLQFLLKTGYLGLTGIASSAIFSGDNFQNNTGTQLLDCKIEELRNGRKINHRIVVAGDGHWFDKHITTDHQRLGKWANNIPHTERHEQMISWLNQENERNETDFVVFNGDLATNRPEDLPIIKKVYNQLDIKYYVTHGNHDHSSEENWKSIWGYGRNHSFEFGEYAVILLNSANEKGDYECANYNWLKDRLNSYNGKKGILIFCHIPQSCNEIPGGGVECEVITDLMLDTENLKMVVYSHKHKLDGHFPIFKSLDNGGRRLDTFFTGHFSAWGLPYLGYRVIEIYGDGKIGTYAFNPDRGNTKNWTLIPNSYGIRDGKPYIYINE